MSFADRTQKCASGQTCVTMTIYETFSPNAAFVRDLFCWDGWSAFTIFEKTPSTAATTATATPPAQNTPPALLSTTLASVGRTSSAPTATSTSTSPDNSSQESDGGKAWVAGTVIGPVVGCVLVGALGFWIGRRRQRKDTIPMAIDPSQYAESSHAYGSKPYLRNPLQELPGSQLTPAAEMEASGSGLKPR
ncbi:hypothetical protein CIHG_09405 [Coccidioides immitis H538.4]|nr:hypothetical protein CIRG_05202 [Coccidioides immitis RMSCC 2394]KMU91645.1 hypothetical protein CIHG_09405 [Coccidioides immitis H538.4]